MREHPDHHDAELLLRLYDLRREVKLRQAREWFEIEFQAKSLEDFWLRWPAGCQENAFFRMVVSYWETAASIVNHGLITGDFFFENTGEFWAVWEKIKHLAPAMRENRNNPFLWSNLESLAGKYEQWMAKRAPEAIAALRRQVHEATAKKPTAHL
jgi:hypothetical protein